MSTKKRVTIEIEFTELSDYKMHLALINERIKLLFKNPDFPLEKECITGWSRHKFNIENIENE